MRLGPIGVPVPAEARDRDLALRVPAVALFLARADCHAPTGPALDGQALAWVCQICRAADGVPLALELAAALIRPLGLEQLARQTAAFLLAPPEHQRGAAGRHRTVGAMVDWSYDGFSLHEQAVLRCLAVLRGCFTLKAAAAVACALAGGAPLRSTRCWRWTASRC